MPTLKDILYMFADTLAGHAALALYLFVILDEQNGRRLKKLPALLLSPTINVLLTLALHMLLPGAELLRYCTTSLMVLLVCSLWVRWAWRLDFWQAFAAVCMGGAFQVAASCLSRMPFREQALNDSPQLAATMAAFWIFVLLSALLLRRLRFGAWFRLLLEACSSRRQTALLLFGLEAAMEVFLLLQNGLQPQYLASYYLLVAAAAALMAGLVVYLARQFDAARKLSAQQDVIAQQQLYERDLEDIRREVRAFRHDYKNLLAGLSEQAGAGELEGLRGTLAALDADFDRRIGEKIRSSTQIGNLRIPQVRSLLLSKLAAMGAQGVEGRLEVLRPVERVNMDVWDFVRCLGILLDNAAEAALEQSLCLRPNDRSGDARAAMETSLCLRPNDRSRPPAGGQATLQMSSRTNGIDMHLGPPRPRLSSLQGIV